MRRLATLALLCAALAPAARAETWSDRHPAGEPIAGDLQFLGDRPHPALPALLPGERYGLLDGMIVVFDPETMELLRPMIAADALPPARPAPRDPVLMGVPRGSEPRYGQCRAWYPGRPADQQPQPGPCDMRVPPGAVLIGR